MDARKGLTFSLFTLLLVLVILKKTGQGHASDNPVQKAGIEHDEESAAYENAIRWEHIRGRG